MNTKMKQAVVGAISALALAACGGGSGAGSGSLSGAPYAFSVNSALHVYSSSSTADQNAQLVEVGLVDQSWSCSDLKASGSTEPAHYAVIAVLGNGTAVAPGDYPVSQSGNAAVQIHVAGQSDFVATSGTIHLTEVTPTGNVKGSFEASDGTTSMSGSFDAPGCDALNG